MQDPLAGTVGIVVILFLVILAILWFVLPFAIFGTKARLDQANVHNQAMQKYLHSIDAELSQIRAMLEKQIQPDAQPPAE